MPICNICKKDCTPDKFLTYTITRNGRDKICIQKKCINCKKDREALKKEKRAQYNKKYRENNREHLCTYLKQYRASHPELHKKRKQKYCEDPEYRKALKIKRRTFYLKNRELYLKAAKKYRETHKQQCATTNKKWVGNNREHVRKYLREYTRLKRATDPNFRLAHKISKAAYRHGTKWKNISSGQASVFSNTKYAGTTAISTERIKFLLAWQLNRCYICNKYFENDFTVEHIIPRSKGGSNHPRNIVLSCKKCNYSRQDKYLWHEWEPETYFPLELPVISANKILNDLGLKGVPQEDNGILLHGPRPKVLYVVSTFACSTRNHDNPELAKWVINKQTQHPEALFLYDLEMYGKLSNVKNMLKSKLGLLDSVGARKFQISSVTPHEAAEFLDQFHVMGKGKAYWHVGLRDSSGILWGVGSFNDLGDKYDCVRLAFRGQVAGGMSKIMLNFLKSVPSKPIFTFVDSRYATGEGHETIGFQYLGKTPVSHYWVFPGELKHYRFFSNVNKLTRNLPIYLQGHNIPTQIELSGIFKTWFPGRHKIMLPMPEAV